jgi:hypothetical protein
MSAIDLFLGVVRGEIARPHSQLPGGIDDWTNRCQMWARIAVDSPGPPRYGSASDNWNACPAQFKHPNSSAPWTGGLVFWATGHPAGHVAPCVGPGLVASSDILRTGYVSVVPIGLIAQRWGSRLLGWTAWSNGKHLETSPVAKL